MIPRALVLTALALLALPAAAAAQERGVTATGTGDAAVKPQNAKDNASIVAAVDVARTAASRAALADARKQADRLAAAAGVKLGSIVALEEVQPDDFGALTAPFPAPARGRAVPVPFPVRGVPFAPLLISPFGKDRYCANVRRPVFRRKDGRRRRVGSRRVRSCIVPGRVTTRIEVTFAIG